MPITTRTIAAALMLAIEDAMNGPDDIPHIVAGDTGQAADILATEGILDDCYFFIALTNDPRFRIDVIRVG